MKTISLIPAVIFTCWLLPAGGIEQAKSDDVPTQHVTIQKQTKLYAEAAAEAQRQAERSIKEVERHIHDAAAQAGRVGPAIKRAFGASYVNTGDLPLVVATHPPEPSTLAELREDLTVIGKLVSDAMAEDHPDSSVHRAMGIVVNWLPGSATSENLYVEGHGVILQATVRYPLAPGKQEDTTKAVETPKNSAWDSARRELFGGEQDEAEVVFPPERREEYDADRVEVLKKGLLKALANASNFRHLGGEETLTVVVRCHGGSRSQILVFKSQDGVSKTQANRSDADSTMTIQIKKSDADALAAGKITEDEFRQRARIAIY